MSNSIQLYHFKYLPIRDKCAASRVSKGFNKTIQKNLQATWLHLENQTLRDPKSATGCLAISHKATKLFIEAQSNGKSSSEFQSIILAEKWEARALQKVYQKDAPTTLMRLRNGEKSGLMDSTPDTTSEQRPQKKQKTVESFDTGKEPYGVTCSIAKFVFIKGLIEDNSEAVFLSAKQLKAFNVQRIELGDYTLSIVQAAAKKLSDLSIFSYLISYLKYSPDEVAIQGTDTPMHCAASLKNPGLVIRLIQLGANPLLKNGKGSTPLHIAAMVLKGDFVNIMNAARARGVNPDEVLNQHRNTPLQVWNMT